jgi:hypothetical protein
VGKEDLINPKVSKMKTEQGLKSRKLHRFEFVNDSSKVIWSQEVAAIARNLTTVRKEQPEDGASQWGQSRDPFHSLDVASAPRVHVLETWSSE